MSTRSGQKAELPNWSSRKNWPLQPSPTERIWPAGFFFSHNNLDGETPFDRIQGLGNLFLNAGENIYGGDGALNTPQMALQIWLNSSSQKKAMLNPDYSEVGVGVVYLQGSHLGAYFSIVFGQPNN